MVCLDGSCSHRPGNVQLSLVIHEIQGFIRDFFRWDYQGWTQIFAAWSRGPHG